MKPGFVSSSAKVLMCFLATLIATPLFFSTMAGAAIYDDFSSPGIDESKWTVAGDGFTQPGDGCLYYSYKGPDTAKLTSTALYTSGIFTMPFADYLSNNNALPAQGLGSVVAIGLGSKSTGKWVRIERGQVQPTGGITGGYIEVNWVLPTNPDPGKIHVNYVPSDVMSGSLQLRYDGGHVTFFYRAHKTHRWTQMVITGHGGEPVLDANNHTQPLIITPEWEAAVPMFIQAIPGGSDSDRYALSFRVDKVSVKRSPVADAVDSLQDVIAEISDLETDCFKNANLHGALINELNALLQMVDQGSYRGALEKLQNDILKKTDGCAASGRPDKNDWITACEEQREVYPIIVEIISLLKRLI